MTSARPTPPAAGAIETIKARIGPLEHRLMNAMSDYGERRGIDWLTYNPLRMRQFHRYAARDAPGAMRAFSSVFPEARSFVDVGCGSGAYGAEAIRQGHHAIGCERSRVGRLLARRQGLACVPFDLSREPPAEIDRSFDLAYTFEVAEHLPAPLGDRLVSFIAKLAPTVVFSAATPGQGGTGHVNEQPPGYWHERLASAGQRHDPDASERLRAAFASEGVEGVWLLENVNVYRRG